MRPRCAVLALALLLGGAGALAAAAAAAPRAQGEQQARDSGAAAAFALIPLGSRPEADLPRLAAAARQHQQRRRRLLGFGKVDVGGSVRDGYFYAQLAIGTPQQHFTVIVDTGSTMTYVPCYDCAHCGSLHDDAPYNPSESSTSSWVNCTDASCFREEREYSCEPWRSTPTPSSSSSSSSSSSRSKPRSQPPARDPDADEDDAAFEDDSSSGDGAADALAKAVESALGRRLAGARKGRKLAGGSDDGLQCTYSISYAEQSSSRGRIVRDVVQLPGNATQLPVVAFGCEAGETGEIYKQAADGLLGMGNSHGAFHAQLASSGVIRHVFSLCFGFPDGGALLLGDAPHPLPLPPAAAPPPVADGANTSAADAPAAAAANGSAPATVWVPLIPSTHNHYYRVPLKAVVLGPQGPLEVPRSTFDGGYGAVVDSGTTFLYLPTNAFTAFAARVRAAAVAAQLTESTDKYADTCWSGPQLAPDWAGIEAVFPTGRLEFAGGGALALPPHRYLFQLAPRGGYGRYCLGVFDNGGSGSLIGGIATRNVLVTYDLEQRRVGFADVDCHALGRMPASKFVTHMPLAQKQPIDATNSSAAAAASLSAAAAATTAAGAAAQPPAAQANAGRGSGASASALDSAVSAAERVAAKAKAAIHGVAESVADATASPSEPQAETSSPSPAPGSAGSELSSQRVVELPPANVTGALGGANISTAAEAAATAAKIAAAAKEAAAKEAAAAAAAKPSPPPKVYWGTGSSSLSPTSAHAGAASLAAGKAAGADAPGSAARAPPGRGEGSVALGVVLAFVAALLVGVAVWLFPRWRRNPQDAGFQALSTSDESKQGLMADGPSSNGGSSIQMEMGRLVGVQASRQAGAAAGGLANGGSSSSSSSSAGGGARRQQQPGRNGGGRPASAAKAPAPGGALRKGVAAADVPDTLRGARDQQAAAAAPAGAVAAANGAAPRLTPPPGGRQLQQQQLLPRPPPPQQQEQPHPNFAAAFSLHEDVASPTAPGAAANSTTAAAAGGGGAAAGAAAAAGESSEELWRFQSISLDDALGGAPK